MNCPRHPHKRVVTNCRECGTGFCIECVQETDQTTLCPECHRRRVDEIDREFNPSRPTEAKVAPGISPGPATRELEEEREEFEARHPSHSEREISERPSPAEREAKRPSPPEKARARLFRGREGKRGKGESPWPRLRESPAGVGTESGGAARSAGAEDFLALGPDEDFSELEREGGRSFRLPWMRRRKTTGGSGEAARLREEVSEAGEVKERGKAGTRRTREAAREAPSQAEPGVVAETERRKTKPASGREVASPAAPAAPGDELLDDVVSRLLGSESAAGVAGRAAGEGVPAEAPASEDVEEILSTLLRRGTGAEARPRAERVETAPEVDRSAMVAASAAVDEETPSRVARERRREREERPERWSFLAQPRASEHTELASRWWGAALFIFLMLLLGALLWGLPNAYLVPRDTEYGLHAVAIGILLGLLFWWKAGRKHGTKLAVQAALTTFFALFLGESLHWFLIIAKNAALRTIFFDLVSFRFIWEHGAEIMRHTLEAMFPGAFVWIMILPTALAFLIGFGMPPIPEIFFQFGRAVRE